MHTESLDQVGLKLAGEAIAAEGALREMNEQRRVRREHMPSEVQTEGTAIRGLVVAVPVSLVLWMAIGLLLRALMH